MRLPSRLAMGCFECGVSSPLRIPGDSRVAALAPRISGKAVRATPPWRAKSIAQNPSANLPPDSGSPASRRCRSPVDVGPDHRDVIHQTQPQNSCPRLTMERRGCQVRTLSGLREDLFKFESADESDFDPTGRFFLFQKMKELLHIKFVIKVHTLLLWEDSTETLR
jgi:hypothetical protein